MQVLPWLVMGATAVQGGLEIAQTLRAGDIAKDQSVIDANAEGDAAREREIVRKKNLRRALSSQLAQAGATGVKFSEGSPARIAQLDISQAASDLAIDSASSAQRRRALLLQGSNAKRASIGSAVTKGLDTAIQTISLIPE